MARNVGRTGLLREPLLQVRQAGWQVPPSRGRARQAARGVGPDRLCWRSARNVTATPRTVWSPWQGCAQQKAARRRLVWRWRARPALPGATAPGLGRPGRQRRCAALDCRYLDAAEAGASAAGAAAAAGAASLAAGAAAVAAAGAGAAAAGADAAGSLWEGSEPCFSPPMSSELPPFMITNSDKAANKINPTISFHMILRLPGGSRLQGFAGLCSAAKPRQIPRVRPPPEGAAGAAVLSRWRRCPRPWFHARTAGRSQRSPKR